MTDTEIVIGGGDFPPSGYIVTQGPMESFTDEQVDAVRAAMLRQAPTHTVQDVLDAASGILTPAMGSLLARMLGRPA